MIRFLPLLYSLLQIITLFKMQSTFNQQFARAVLSFKTEVPTQTEGDQKWLMHYEKTFYKMNVMGTPTVHPGFEKFSCD